MRLFYTLLSGRQNALFRSVALFASLSNICLAFDSHQVSDLVKNLPCKDGETIEQVLEGAVRRSSRRDLGWRIFQEADYYDIERAVLINKGTELRYRWRVLADGNVQTQNGRAQKLCSQDSG